MSPLNHLSSDRHLGEAALAALWTDGCLSLERPAHPHLEHCAQCRARLAELSQMMDAVRADGLAEADEAFSTERLAAQHGAIMHRIEASEHPARVISFPASSRPVSPGVTHVRRWITAAAAAGLLVGLAAGQFMDLRRTLGGSLVPTEVGRVTADAKRTAGPIQPASVIPPDPDAAFMEEVDDSVRRYSLRELRAIDEFTPRAPFTEDRR